MKSFLNGLKYTLQLLLSLTVVALLGYGGYLFINEMISLLQKVSTELATAIVAAATTVVVSVGSILLARYIESRKQAELEIRNKKIPVYEKFFELMFDIFQKKGVSQDPKRLNMALMDLTKEMIIWGSDDVIRQWSIFRAGAGDEKMTLSLVENMLLAIRKDIGHKNRNIGKLDLMALFITDIEKYREKK